jgi:hypothetical protein
LHSQQQLPIFLVPACGIPGSCLCSKGAQIRRHRRHLLPPCACACRFDGLTQLHAFHFDGGQVSYRSRHLFPAIEQHLARGGITTTFGPPPAPGGGRLPVRAALLRKLLRTLRLAPAQAPPRDPATGRDVYNVGVTVGHVGGK